VIAGAILCGWPLHPMQSERDEVDHARYSYLPQLPTEEPHSSEAFERYRKVWRV
jgi:hypothetical protein